MLWDLSLGLGGGGEVGERCELVGMLSALSLLFFWAREKRELSVCVVCGQKLLFVKARFWFWFIFFFWASVVTCMINSDYLLLG